MRRRVASTLTLDVTEPAHLVFSIAASGAYAPHSEHFSATSAGSLLPAREVCDDHRTRLHDVHAEVGELVVRYTATIDGAGTPLESHEVERLRYVRPSRYAESDTLASTATAEFAGIVGADALLLAVSSWVGTRLRYVSGSSAPTDGAVETLLDRQGVCRDYAHLCIALLRARGVPARMVSVYAPGLIHMDFHAVVEAWVGDSWRVVDATALAPRSTLVRIATGRDAADTAFLNVLSGRAQLLHCEVSAVADELPNDDLDRLVSLS